jgi:hypothetical protein
VGSFPREIEKARIRTRQGFNADKFRLRERAQGSPRELALVGPGVDDGPDRQMDQPKPIVARVLPSTLNVDTDLARKPLDERLDHDANCLSLVGGW